MKSLLVYCCSFTCLCVVTAQEVRKGVLAGDVIDGSNGQPIPKAAVTISTEPPTRIQSDEFGKYRIELNPGRYRVLVSAEKYLDAVIETVEIRPGETADGTVVLATKSQVTKVEVQETVSPVAATAESMLTERKLAAVVTDGLSAEEIRQTVASDAAGALQKVTGVSVVDSGYVYVRGLGERYSSTMLNNSLIPTTEPEKRVVPLDLFPAALIDSIRVVKSYTPDLPGEFSAGVVQLTTVDFPAQPVLKVSMTTGYNTATTRKRFLTYPGGGLDAFGFDDGTRSLPAAVPADQRIIPGRFTSAQLQEIGRSFPVNWEPTFVEQMRPQQSYSVVGGSTFRRVGLVGALTFSNRPQNQAEIQRYIRMGGGRPLIFTNYEDFNVGNEAIRLGGVLNVAFRLTANNKIVVRNTLTRDADKEAREFRGYDGSNDSTLWSQRLRWVERSLLSTSVEGTHALVDRGNWNFRWQFTTAESRRDEPDMREVIRGQLDDGRWSFAALSSSGMRFSNGLKERLYEPLGEISKPFYKGWLTGAFTVGFRGTFRDRSFQARRFRFIPVRSTTLNLFAPSNQLFARENIRPDGFQIIEFTRATDRYEAAMDVYAGYVMADVNLGARWRLTGGVRVEDAGIRVTTLDPLIPNAKPQIASLINRDPMPAINVTYMLTPRQNLRAGFSKTVSRPDFRELSPFDFNNVYGGFVTQGNPNLVRATVQNTDFRWEWFPGGNRLLAASFFHKNFHNPIEVTILPANDLRQTFVNAAGARNAGFELEGRTTLSVLTPRLRELFVGGNYTFVDSNIRIRPEDATLLTSKSRPLIGTSRHIFNILSEWRKPRWRSEARFDYTFVGRRVTDVGTFGVPDIYQEPLTLVDFSYRFYLDEQGKYTLRFTGENLANNHYHWTQGEFTQRSFRLGRTFTVGLAVTIF
ncbi:MAG: TonB-dependent receptor [Bryobacteraceae bacterium]|nr:TonB-dependent receptor [Bryobacteraceae bacterium]